MKLLLHTATYWRARHKIQNWRYRKKTGSDLDLKSLRFKWRECCWNFFWRKLLSSWVGQGHGLILHKSVVSECGSAFFILWITRRGLMYSTIIQIYKAVWYSSNSHKTIELCCLLHTVLYHLRRNTSSIYPIKVIGNKNYCN